MSKKAYRAPADKLPPGCILTELATMMHTPGGHAKAAKRWRDCGLDFTVWQHADRVRMLNEIDQDIRDSVCVILAREALLADIAGVPRRPALWRLLPGGLP